MTGNRGQAAILGLVLLIGMVAMVSVGILMYAGASTAELQQEMENERIEASFVELSQTMATTAETGDTIEIVDFAAGEHGAVVINESGRMVIEGEGIGEDGKIDVTIGAIEYEGEDGTRIAYQAGGVFRETGNETRIVSAPPLHYDNATSTFSFPVVEVANDGQLDSDQVYLSHTGNVTTHRDATYVEDTITVTVTSEYCRGWETYFERQTRDSDGQAIREQCHEGNSNTVKVKLGRFDLESGTFEDGVVVYDGYRGQTGGFDVTESDERSPPALDDLIDSMIQETSAEDPGVENLTDVNSPIPNGTYVVDELNPEDFGGELTFDISEGDTTVIVEEDIVVDNTKLLVDKPENGENHSLQIFAAGNTNIDAGEACVKPCDVHAAFGNQGDIDSKHLQIYGKSDMHISIGTGLSYFEGILYAPPGDNEFEGPNEVHPHGNCDEQLCYQSQVDSDGSLIVGSLHSQTPNAGATYDESLEDFNPDLNLEGYVFPPHLTYLNIVEHEVDVESG